MENLYNNQVYINITAWRGALFYIVLLSNINANMWLSGNFSAHSNNVCGCGAMDDILSNVIYREKLTNFPDKSHTYRREHVFFVWEKEVKFCVVSRFELQKLDVDYNTKTHNTRNDDKGRKRDF